MSNKSMARRATAEVAFDGVDITASILPYLLSITYTDSEEDEADDLQLKLQDREGIWLTSWLTQAINAAASKKISQQEGEETNSDTTTERSGFTISAVIARLNWNGDGRDSVLDCGQFELDSVDCSGPPAVIQIKATALPFTSQIRQTKRSKAWESYRLSGIAKEIAKNAGMACMYLAAIDPEYKRVEQYQTSDISFLSLLCHEAGLSLKVVNNILVLFDQADYEASESVLTIKKGDRSYTKWKLKTGEADVHYASCRVYWTTSSGTLIEGVAKVEDYDAEDESNQQLEIRAKVDSIAQAQTLAAKYLRLHNKYQKTASFTIPGNPLIGAGMTVELEGWGAWSGKYIVSQAKHSLSNSYTTQIDLRKVLEGY